MTQPADPYNPSAPDQAASASNPAANATSGTGAPASSFFSGPSTPGQMLGYAAVGVALGIGLNLLLSR
jgi:hypothetical protein